LRASDLKYIPIRAGLIGTDLTPSQIASAVRTGTVSGSNVSVTGILALVDTVASAQAGFTVTNISSSPLTASGQVAGDVMTLNGTSTFVASGTYSLNGQGGSFTETIRSSDTATFMQGGAVTAVAGNGNSRAGKASPVGAAAAVPVERMGIRFKALAGSGVVRSLVIALQ
jgi:hypothetical protein